MAENYNELNIHPRDSRINFIPETHTYIIDGCDGRIRSVTEVVAECFEKFDEIYWSERKAAQMGVSAEDLREQWRQKARQAAQLGVELHDRIEKYYQGCDCGADDEAYRLFKMFASVVRLYPYRTEWRIFDEEYGVAGTLDFLARNPADGSFEIMDWKRSDRIISDGKAVTESRYGKFGLYPVEHVSDCTYMHYALQVSIYRYILESRYGINVVRGRLGIFHPSYTRPYIVDVPYLRGEAAAVLRHHSFG